MNLASITKCLALHVYYSSKFTSLRNSLSFGSLVQVSVDNVTIDLAISGRE